jgi:hypothetical protein
VRRPETPEAPSSAAGEIDDEVGYADSRVDPADEI